MGVLTKGLSVVIASVALTFACSTGGSTVPKPSGHVEPSPTAPMTTVPGIPKHVLTWAYDDVGVGGVGATAAEVQAFTNWDEETTDTPPGKAERDCYPGAGAVSCQAVWYQIRALPFSKLG
jgi:hypothetical protein